MKRKELVVFSYLNLLCGVFFGLVLGARGVIAWLWWGLKSLGDDSTNIVKLWNKLLYVTVKGTMASSIILLLTLVLVGLNYFFYTKKYREFLKSLE